MYKKHLASGGRMEKEIFAHQIPELMRSWSKLSQLDSYESLVYDPITEMEYINNMFMEDHKQKYMFGPEQSKIPRTDKLDVYGYRGLDVHGDESKIVSDNIYRFGNKIPFYQKVNHLRYHDRDNDGLYLGRSIKHLEQKRYNMKEVMDHVNKEYAKIDDNHVDYYGQNNTIHEQDSMDFTGWDK
jgi:hypothetical protein